MRKKLFLLMARIIFIGKYLLMEVKTRIVMQRGVVSTNISIMDEICQIYLVADNCEGKKHDLVS